ncbi:hypothetical protein [Micromonospora carbonacea]|uniref:Uncharacterized protein n=1 Tax=Micromonospora carbonacea TaxID=47853 RepID=A0A1C4Y5J7_9ACTN|nr:hypothetical protein [Micromonospora carbonacea]MBB5825173.1 hypothetical protein [Micromonospora carbonacea]QLD26731.1 hypothetical protein HXZ27_23045 [Micromonospora carbonacea]SCF15993.1 hypothetical protein GA0070563_105380 [Micromonospora carbonacea]
MLIDCDRCRVRGAGCGGCLVTALLDADAPGADLGPAELRAIEVLARAGFDVEVLPDVDAATPPPWVPRPGPIRRRAA